MSPQQLLDFVSEALEEINARLNKIELKMDLRLERIEKELQLLNKE